MKYRDTSPLSNSSAKVDGKKKMLMVANKHFLKKNEPFSHL